MYRESFIAVHNSVSKDSEIKKKKTYTHCLKTEHSLTCWTPFLFERIIAVWSLEILNKQHGSTEANVHVETSKYDDSSILNGKIMNCLKINVKVFHLSKKRFFTWAGKQVHN